ncbi:hypothetical protein [Pontibacter akesuensis]|uniref:Uncharacterized protein n=1 Tax=Pontibacter akesuensis TaxID=388950 RepID=A0A1I7IMP4_9BACT|nr:hypothetical protein [Pontibacter akesuensis]GHA67925.1 hypothetical protein GCM10007389_21580 [Pontibacter akesuensis]SFU74187.1 hypothetical protein SAMN04487941_2329 [Pontibacter akesuensis]
MKPFDELPPRQKFFRQNIVRVIIYGGFLLVLYWSVTEILEIKREKDVEAQPKAERISV